MKILKSIGIVLFILQTACTYTHSETGRTIDIQNDLAELELARKSLDYIREDRREDLRLLFSEETGKNVHSEQLDWLINKGQSIMKYNEYPGDSLVTVSYIVQKKGSTEITYKEFNFPFINERDEDSTMYFEVTVIEGEINKLFISTGMRIKRIN